MPLPNPTSKDAWTLWSKFYKIQTPTFKLTSVEKPDFSPFLIHMTGKNSLLSILKGGNAPNDAIIPKNHGYIKSCIPDYESKMNYDSKVVCFTESPTFALDFFRYRSIERYKRDQQFGIGFSKDDLIKKRDVRPVVYLDEETNRALLALCYSVINDQSFFMSFSYPYEVKKLFLKIKPLLFPLLETTLYQGFMWEREWRYPHEGGITFPFDEIRVICCPTGEREEIESILGEYLSNIQVIESWREYDEVTNYLNQRSKTYNASQLNSINTINNINQLESLLEQNQQTLNALGAYYDVFKDTLGQLENNNNIHNTIEGLKKTSKEVTERIRYLKEKEKKAPR